MDSKQRDALAVFFENNGHSLTDKSDEFIKSTEALVKQYQLTEQWKDKMVKPSAVNAELDQLIKDLDKLSNTTLLYLRRVSQEVQGTGVDPVAYLKLSASLKYERPRTDKAIRLSIPIMVERMLTSYGINCHSRKNSAFVEFLGILLELLELNHDAYTLARDFYFPA